MIKTASGSRSFPLAVFIIYVALVIGRVSNVQGYIDDKDRKWKATRSEEITPFMQTILNNELSQQLSNRIRFYEEIYSHKVYGEVFITNKYGANIAQTGKTSDYRQDDEEW